MTRDHESDGGAGAAQYPVMSDKPVEIHNPQRKMRLIAIAYALAILVATVAGSYIAANIAIDRNDKIKQQLRDELNERARQRDVRVDEFQAVLDQYRRDMCAVTSEQVQTPAVVDIRTRYRCGAAAGPRTGHPATPGALPTAGPPIEATGPQARRTTAAPGSALGPPAPAPALGPRPPGPGPVPEPPPSTSPPPRLCVVVLPLLGVCIS